MKKRIFMAVVILLFIISLYEMTDKNFFTQMVVTNETTSSVANIEQALQDISVSSEDVYTVKLETPEDLDRLEMVGEIEVGSEPLPFPDSYYDPETETYREEEFWDDMELVALVCVAEAESESEMGKRLVIDTIFNRLESPYYPNTISKVVYARDQYSCVTNGRLEKVEYNEYIANLVMEELANRTNSKVIYFNTNRYFGFGTPIVKEGHHYFSGR